MKLLLYLSDFIVPVTILGIVAYGVFNKVNVCLLYTSDAADD